jgi:hypothetical protein
VVLTQRERQIVNVTGVLLALFVLYYFLLDPLLSRRSTLVQQVDDARRQQDAAKRLLDNSARMTRQWNDLVAGPIKRNGSDAASQVQHSVGDWANAARLGGLSINMPDRAEKEKDFYKATLRVTGTGTLDQIAHFLFNIQTANVPVRITDMRVSTRKEATDDLALEMGLATTYLAPESDKADKAKQPFASATSRETAQ